MTSKCVHRGEVPLPCAVGACAAIGNFDGVHVGHRALVERAAELARSMNRPCVAVTFDPHPAQVLAGRDLESLGTLEDRVQRLLGAGADGVWIVPFTMALARLEPIAFIEDLLLDRLQVRGLVVGPDFRFGRGAAGGVELLMKTAVDQGFHCEELPFVTVDEQRVSSSTIRDCLRQGDVQRAAACLLRPYELPGVIVTGDARGRTLGFPTANLSPTGGLLVPGNGVYAVHADLRPPAGTTPRGDAASMLRNLPAVANIGHRPTFGGSARSVEVHLLDQSLNLYGWEMTVRFRARLREELRFDSAQALIVAMNQDVRQARELLASFSD